jgi:putative AlgH/UPF0301 family transcriptional regulator
VPAPAPPQSALNDAKRLQLHPPPPPASPGASSSSEDAAAAVDDSRWALLPHGRSAHAAPAPLTPLAAPVAGALLLSHPRLGDYFHRKVILLVSHDDGANGMGTTGYVLNAAAQLRLGQLLPRGAQRGGEAEAREGGGSSSGGGGFAGGRVRRRRRAAAAHASSAHRGPSFLHVPLSAAEAAMLSADPDVRAHDDNKDEYDPDAYDDLPHGAHDARDDADAFDLQQLEDAVAAIGGETASFSIDVGDGNGILVTAISAGGDDNADAAFSNDATGFLNAAATAVASAVAGGGGGGGGDAGEAGFLRAAHTEACERLAQAAGTALLRRCSRAEVYNGGPVPGGGVLHTCQHVGGAPVLPPDASPAGGGRAVFLGGDVGALAQHVAGSGSEAPADVRFFAGEAGWSPGQLAAELARGEWLLAQGSAAWVLGGAAHAPGAQRGCMWQRALRAMGGEHAVMAGLPAHLGPEQAQAEPQFMLRMRL